MLFTGEVPTAVLLIEQKARQCMNCLGHNDTTSKNYIRLRKEVKLFQRTALNNSSHKDAAAQVRKTTERISLPRSKGRLPRMNSEKRKPPSSSTPEESISLS